MQGHIIVKSELNVGTRFCFNIQAGVSKQETRVHLNYNLADIEGKRILVIDDNETNRWIMQLQLENWKLIPSLASSGAEALAMMDTQTFDLVITDMQMPVMDGLELTALIKKKSAFTPVILLSSIGDDTRNKSVDLFISVLNKPVKQQQLHNVIQLAFNKVAELPMPKPTSELLDKNFAGKHPLQILVAEDNMINQN